MKQKAYLQCAVESPDKVQSIIYSLVFTSLYKGGSEFPFGRWFTISYW